MTKGPVAIIPVAIWVAFYVLRREWSGLRRMRLLPGSMIALAIAAPWPIYMMVTHGRRFLDVIVLSEVVARVRGQVGGSRGLFYYVDVWPADLLPWTPFFLAALVWLALARGRLEPDTRRGVSLALVWFAGVIALFTLSKAKVPHYLLPSHPAAALLTGLFIERVARTEASRGLWRAATSVVLILLPAAGVLAWALLRRAPDPAMTLPAVLLPALLALGAIAIAVSGRRRGPIAASVALAMTSAITAAYAALVVVPGLAGLQTVPQLAARITATAAPASRMGQYGVVSAGLVHYTRHRVRSVDECRGRRRVSSGPRRRGPRAAPSRRPVDCRPRAGSRPRNRGGHAAGPAPGPAVRRSIPVRRRPGRANEPAEWAE